MLRIADIDNGFKINRLPDGRGFSIYSMDVILIYRWVNRKLENTESYYYGTPNFTEIKQRYNNESTWVQMSNEMSNINIVKS